MEIFKNEFGLGSTTEDDDNTNLNFHLIPIGCGCSSRLEDVEYIIL